MRVDKRVRHEFKGILAFVVDAPTTVRDFKFS